MHNYIRSALLLFACVLSKYGLAQGSSDEVFESLTPLDEKNISPKLREQSFFTDRVGSCIIYFDTQIESPVAQNIENEFITIFEIEAFDTPDSNEGKSVAIVRFLPKTTGLSIFPSLEFRSETTLYRTNPLQFIVDEPVSSELITLSFSTDREQVYVGQPFPIKMSWRGHLKASAIRNLQLNPPFFNHPNIEIVIPRNTAPEEVQVGLPIGGRRVIANRTLDSNRREDLGLIELTIFLRIDEPGTYEFASTRLECALTSANRGAFGRYAAHFNNLFFELPDSHQKYRRIFTLSNALEISVKALPEETGDLPFSGLFEPLELEAQVSPTNIEIGQMSEVEISVKSLAPHGMIALPSLTSQRGLRSKFLIDQDFARQWQATGSLFRTRFRPLITTIKSFPSLSFKTFDPSTEQYVIRSTRAVPLTVNPSEDSSFIPIDTFPEATISLTNQPEGTWHNKRPNIMNSFLNLMHTTMQDVFWPMLLLPPLCFFILFPRAMDKRRRKIYPKYHEYQTAYKAFRKAAKNTKARWDAFINFLSVRFDVNKDAWTCRDSQHILTKLGARPEDIDQINEMHLRIDERTFSKKETSIDFRDFEQAAKRVSLLALRASALFIAIGLICHSPLVANPWKEAEALFEKANQSEYGSDAQSALLQEAALKFEESAENYTHAGEAWYNAGNAWFQSGELGRAIAAYRHASIYRPFDKELRENLSAARALTLNSIEAEESAWETIPVSWIKAGILITNLIFWSGLLGTIIYRNRPIIVVTTIAGIAFFIISANLIHRVLQQETYGTVITESVFAKKGPSYAFANAFNEPLHDGLEFTLEEIRKSWARIKLADNRICWVPISQIQLITQ
ncbi:MAG: tetratricopeptide repeat protein [Verrucomicrobiota bacterium]